MGNEFLCQIGIKGIDPIGHHSSKKTTKQTTDCGEYMTMRAWKVEVGCGQCGGNLMGYVDFSFLECILCKDRFSQNQADVAHHVVEWEALTKVFETPLNAIFCVHCYGKLHGLIFDVFARKLLELCGKYFGREIVNWTRCRSHTCSVDHGTPHVLIRKEWADKGGQSISQPCCCRPSSPVVDNRATERQEPVMGNRANVVTEGFTRNVHFAPARLDYNSRIEGFCGLHDHIL
mmetsp:Transcript_3095/g.6453  ORF Transcript_3095/g.6453 Transcript_3095/m.6453 type:complete len:232 (+) Transcript_3095:369-1064(+)